MGAHSLIFQVDSDRDSHNDPPWVALVLSPESRRFIYVAAYAENLELVSRDAKTATTIRQDDRSFARSYQDISRAEGSFCARPARVCAYEGGDSTVAGSWRYVRLFLC